MIVFEGTNRTGKSTLAKNISGLLGLPIIRVCNISGNKGLAPMAVDIEELGAKTNDFYEDMVIMEFMNQLYDKPKAIFDRSLPSAHAYRVYKGKEGLSDEILKWWFESLRRKNGLYVWVVSDYYEISEKRGVKEGWMETPDEYSKLMLAFDDLYEMAFDCDCKVLRLENNKEKEIEENTMKILRKLNEP